jgi:hypothetical protein
MVIVQDKGMVAALNKLTVTVAPERTTIAEDVASVVPAARTVV